MAWTVRHGDGKLLVITNETGAKATDVEMKLRGAAVGTPNTVSIPAPCAIDGDE